MKAITCLLLLITCFYGDVPKISVTDAEKVLGQTARMSASSGEEKNGVSKQRYTYVAIADTLSHLYYLSAQYPVITAAQKAYAAIVAGNVGMPGQEKITGLGDEAFFHTDKQHFYLIIFRKKDQVITLKVNKLTGKTSAPELRKLAAKLEHNV
ncbi:hypothetical protein [Mucilaginibacter sp.]|uniref:hypothetical protein n=1 Tax=Mucilaginibacter sp. TaxID=1882438 RepID=UPI0025F9ACCE|nr:hypothetical protein [Mucilaginibacter sp.]